jgi:hypothetical protein
MEDIAKRINEQPITPEEMQALKTYVSMLLDENDMLCGRTKK